LAALPVSDALAATNCPEDNISGESQTVDDRLSRLAAAFEQRAGEAANSAELPADLNSLLAGFLNGGGFRNGGFINGGGFRNGGGFVNGGGFRNGGGGGGFANFRNW
jgi:rSAM-associated Gly-rich repeat protein